MGRPRIHESKVACKQAFDEANRQRWLNKDPRLEPGEKRCCRCQKTKLRSGFARCLSNKDGLQAWCDLCRHQYHVDDPRKQMLVNARSRAAHRGLPFRLTIDDLSIPATCPVLGIPLRVGTGLGPSPDSPSVDRIDNSKGYVPENVRVVSWRANRVHGDATLEELRSIVAFLEKSSSG